MYKLIFENILSSKSNVVHPSRQKLKKKKKKRNDVYKRCSMR